MILPFFLFVVFFDKFFVCSFVLHREIWLTCSAFRLVTPCAPPSCEINATWFFGQISAMMRSVLCVSCCHFDHRHKPYCCGYFNHKLFACHISVKQLQPPNQVSLQNDMTWSKWSSGLLMNNASGCRQKSVQSDFHLCCHLHLTSCLTNEYIRNDLVAWKSKLNVNRHAITLQRNRYWPSTKG